MGGRVEWKSMVSQPENGTLSSKVLPEDSPQRSARVPSPGAMAVGGLAAFAAAALTGTRAELAFFVATGMSFLAAGIWLRISGAQGRTRTTRSDRRLLDAVAAAPDACCLTDGDGKVIGVNAEALRQGVITDQGKLPAALIAQAGSADGLVYRLWRSALRDGIAWETAKAKDGRALRVSAQCLAGARFLWRIALVGEAEGDPVGGAGVSEPARPIPPCDDVSRETPCPSAERSVFERLMNDLPVALLRLTTDGRIEFANLGAERLLGGKLQTGVNAGRILEGLGRPFGDRVSEAARYGGSPNSEVARALVDNREVFLQVSLTRADFAGESALLAVLSDATELKTLEAQFVQSQKMQAVGQLAGGVAHDFNNLLTAINGHCDLLLLRHEAGDPDHGDLVQIRQNANRAAGLVSQLLAFSRKQTLRPRILHLSDTLSEVTHLLNRLLGEKVKLTIEHGDDLFPVRVDERQFEQVIMNLVVNARDAMPKGGTVRIRTSNLTLEQPLERDRARIPADDYVLVEVTDTGTGIPQDHIRKIFEPFFTTKRVGEGTGLGLSTVYGIIKQTGGFIFADSTPGEGTTFAIYLCAHNKTEEKMRDGAGRPEAARDVTGDGVVLLVEDEAPIRSFSARALRMRGYTVLEAGSGEEALALLSDENVHVDVLVSDVIMPGKDGPTWVREARRQRPDVKVIFISGYTEEAFGHGCPRIPDAAFLPKPFNIKELTEKVKERIEMA
ncbi:MAG: ATP-binding protein [Paracoccaceae bacterium]